MVGLMTLTWAWAETTLAMTIGIINKEIEPIKGYREAPLSLKSRVACFRVALRDITILHPLQEEGRALAVRFGVLSKRRNEFIHGAAWEHHEGGFESVAIGVKAGDFDVRNQRFNQGDAILLTTEIATLQDDAANFMLKVTAIVEGRKSRPA
jgi:hypothetical protein